MMPNRQLPPALRQAVQECQREISNLIRATGWEIYACLGPDDNLATMTPERFQSLCDTLRQRPGGNDYRDQPVMEQLIAALATRLPSQSIKAREDRLRRRARREGLTFHRARRRFTEGGVAVAYYCSDAANGFKSLYPSLEAAEQDFALEEVSDEP
jgi:hypothetical protein